jgi:hypothetical protein
LHAEEILLVVKVEKEIVRLLNLVNNPSYTHLEDTECLQAEMAQGNLFTDYGLGWTYPTEAFHGTEGGPFRP